MESIIHYVCKGCEKKGITKPPYPHFEENYKQHYKNMKKIITILIISGTLLSFNLAKAQTPLTPNRINSILKIMRELDVSETKINQIRVILNQEDQPVIQKTTPAKPIKTFKERQQENYQKNGFNATA